jgi:ABC-type ATPase involved in cell division
MIALQFQSRDSSKSGLKTEQFARANLISKIVEILKERKRFVILSSPPDSGKSTVLKMMVSQRPMDAVYKYIPVESQDATGFDELRKPV